MRTILLLLCAAGALIAESAAGLTWSAPAGWTSKGPSPMRAATYEVDGVECTMNYFGAGQGGTIEANLTRWKGQFTAEGGKAIDPKTATKTVNGLKVTTLDIAGTYTMTGGMVTTPQTPKPGTRMLAAIIEGPQGSIYIKFAGPAKTIAANAAKFDALIASFHKE